MCFESCCSLKKNKTKKTPVLFCPSFNLRAEIRVLICKDLFYTEYNVSSEHSVFTSFKEQLLCSILLTLSHSSSQTVAVASLGRLSSLQYEIQADSRNIISMSPLLIFLRKLVEV